MIVQLDEHIAKADPKEKPFAVAVREAAISATVKAGSGLVAAYVKDRTGLGGD